MFSLHLTKYSFILKRLYVSKAWTYKEATSWQHSFQWQNIPKEHVSVTFSRSSGPGGQNVNKGLAISAKSFNFFTKQEVQ